MTQPAEAVGGEPPVDAKADAVEAFENLAETFFEDDEEEPVTEEGAEPESEELTEDDIEDEAEADDLPPIEAPVSWDAEAKEKFAELPRDVQEYVAKREGERERFVQQKSQEATRAQREAEQTALAQLAQIEQGYSQHFQQLAGQLQPQRPNPALLQHDPAQFYAQQAAYEDSIAQQQQLQQRASEYAQQAQMRQAQIEQAEHAEQARIITEHFPEYADPTTGPKLQAELSSVAKELGYPPELISQARAADILAMRTAAEWKAKAARYDALNAKKMEKVRAAKGLPRVAKPGVAVSAEQTRQARSDAAWARAKAGRNLAEKADGFAEWASNNGIL